jgi:hypothetical protein
MVFSQPSMLILGFIFLNMAALLLTYAISFKNLKKAAKLQNQNLGFRVGKYSI